MEITFNELYQFFMILIGIVSLILQANKKK